MKITEEQAAEVLADIREYDGFDGTTIINQIEILRAAIGRHCQPTREDAERVIAKRCDTCKHWTREVLTCRRYPENRRCAVLDAFTHPSDRCMDWEASE